MHILVLQSSIKKDWGFINLRKVKYIFSIVSHLIIFHGPTILISQFENLYDSFHMFYCSIHWYIINEGTMVENIFA